MPDLWPFKTMPLVPALLSLKSSTPLRFLAILPSFLVFTTLSMPLMGQDTFDLQGHRGCRALMPENTLPGFIHAIELGATTLEMDVVISGDGQVIVSHEPWMSAAICQAPGGKAIDPAHERDLNLYKMTYAEIQGYDCGSKGNSKFPDQQKMQALKPSLKMAVRMIRSFAEDHQYPQPRFNIEIKSDSTLYGTYQPDPVKFTDLVVTEVKRLGIEAITTLQSFDINVLEELQKRTDRKYKISYLVEKGKNIKSNLALLTFRPDIYSPEYKMVTEKMVQQCHDLGMQIIPWTINRKEDLDRLKAWGIDGAITNVLTW